MHLLLNCNIFRNKFSRGVTRRVAHETRRDETRDWVHENETRFLHTIFKKSSKMKYMIRKIICRCIWNVLTNHLVMNVISVLLSEYELSYAVKDCKTVKCFAANWLLSCMISWVSSDLTYLHDLWASTTFDLLTPFHKLIIEIKSINKNGKTLQ